MSGYSSPIFCAVLRNLPSVVLIMFAFVMIETLPLLFFFAYSYARRAILSQPSCVATVKSTARSSVMFNPYEPIAYPPSVFSLKNVQSMPSSGTFTGLILAKRSSSFLIATLADSTFGHGSPALGVVVGPLRITWHFLSSASTSSGIALLQAARFSMVKPSISLNLTLPLATSSLSKNASTLSLSLVMIGPIPSPPQIPITMVSSAS